MRVQSLQALTVQAAQASHALTGFHEEERCGGQEVKGACNVAGVDALQPAAVLTPRDTRLHDLCCLQPATTKTKVIPQGAGAQVAATAALHRAEDLTRALARAPRRPARAAAALAWRRCCR